MKKNYLLIETRDRKQKNKRTFLESIWLCHVASHAAAQQTILPTWLDNVVSRIDVAAAASISRHAGHTCFCSRHMQSWTWRQNQSARNLNNFCSAPFRISGHIRWPITPLFFGIFLSFFHSMLSFHYFTSMRGKNLKVLCFKTAIWRTLLLETTVLEIEKEIVRKVVRGDKHNLRKSAKCKAQVSIMCGVNDIDLCVAICRFSQVVFVTSNNFAHNLLFYFQ